MIACGSHGAGLGDKKAIWPSDLYRNCLGKPGVPILTYGDGG